MAKHTVLLALILLVVVLGARELDRRTRHDGWQQDYLRQTYSPLHFQPVIARASDEQCLACHREVLDDRIRARSPAGLAAKDTLAWYQQTSTYQGEQDSFHRRHLATPLARELMDLKCTFCHQGHDPREEAPGASATSPAQKDAPFTLRKQVDPEATCLKCHGQMPWKNMNLPGPWQGEIKDAFRNDCLTGCHERIRTVRHQVNYLKADAIEAAGRKSGDACHGCHGGRAWYRISYPYPRHAWPDMSGPAPAWAAGRPTESDARYRRAPAGPAPAAARH